MEILQLAVFTCLTVLVCGQVLVGKKITDQCTEVFEKQGCTFHIYCRNYVNIHDRNRYLFGADNQDRPEDFVACSLQDSVIVDDRRYYKIILKMEDVGSFADRSIFRENYNGYMGDIIYCIDLSNRGITYNPLSQYDGFMSNLAVLNLSANAIHTVKLSGSDGIESLIEIDYSHNTIIDIENTQDDRLIHTYKRLKKINFSHNYLETIPDGIFYDFVELEYLDLSHNFIYTLNTLTFEGIKNLIVLKLSHNRISEINNSLLRFTKLEHLELSHNFIEKIKAQDFEKLNHLEILDLSFNSILTIENNSFNNLIATWKIILNDNKLEHIDKDIFVPLTNLSYIDISNNNFKTLTQNLFKDKKLSYFSVKGNQIEGQLLKGTFEGLSNVSEIDFSNQKLNSVESFAFYGLLKLETLFLNDNILQTVSKTAFKSLHNLNVLDLSNNHITDIVFDMIDLVNLRSLSLQNNLLTHVSPDYFEGLNSLQYLDLSNNNISQLASNCFGSLGELVNFKISNNPLSGALEPNTFDGLNSLPSLDISGTMLNVVKNGSFSGLIQLKTLNMSRSTIANLHFKSFMNTGAVEIIDLSFNRLVVFQVDTTDLLQLSTLYLNNNLITHVSSTSFKGLSQLSFINFAHNNITVIDNEAFVDQNNLQSLDFSFNPQAKINMTNIIKAYRLNLSGIHSNISFKDISFGTSLVQDLVLSGAGIQNITNAEVRKLNRLGSLVLSYNNIFKVEVGSFSNMSVLKTIDLSNNKINFIQPGVFKDCKMLNLLNISHNFIKTIGYGVFRGSINLEIIDVSFNSINNLQSERFYEVSKLTKLIADHNQIRSVNLGDFSGTSLTELSIGGNPIPCDMVVSLKAQKYPPFVTITAITLDEHKGENVDGILCNMEDSRGSSLHTLQPHKIIDNDKILYEIRDAIYNTSILQRSEPTNDDTNFVNSISNRIENTGQFVVKALKNISHTIEDLSNTNVKTIENETNNIIKTMLKENNMTNIALRNILKAIAAPSVVRQPEFTPISKDIDNSTSVNLIPLINKIKQDFEDTITIEKQNILEQMKQSIEKVENKVSSLNQSISHHVTSPTPVHDALIKSDLKQDQTSETKSFVFMETCVALILLILVAFILYKFYNSGMFIPSRQSQSTRNLPDEENSAL